MAKEPVAKTVLVDGKTYVERADGTLVPAHGATGWARLDAMGDDDIEAAIAADPDAAPVLSAAWFERAELYGDNEKVLVNMRLDARVVSWFKARGRGYQARINAVLRAYVDTYTSK